MRKAQRGQKLRVVSKVLTTLNFLTTPSFSVTTPSYHAETLCPQTIESTF